MTRLEYIKRWARENNKRVEVYYNNELITTVDQPSEAFSLGLDYDFQSVEWNRVDLFTNNER